MDFESCKGINRKQIRQIAKFIRKLLKIKTIKFPVLKALDRLETMFEDKISHIVLPDDCFEKNVMAKLVMEGTDCYCIKIRETVYNNAVNGNRASIGFICHEICHFILIHCFSAGPVLYKNQTGMAFARSVNSKSLPRFKSMERQAMALCGEVMIPYDECKSLSFEEIVSLTDSSDKQTEYFLTRVVNKID